MLCETSVIFPKFCTPDLSELGEVWSAEFWEYDASLGRRWDIDPIDLPWQSPYVAFDGNPIAFSDPLGLAAAPTGDGDGPKAAKKTRDKASNTASRVAMESAFQKNKGQYALNIIQKTIGNDLNAIRNGNNNINLVISFTNDKLFSDDSEEICGRTSVFYKVDKDWKNQSDIKDNDLNKINENTEVKIEVLISTVTDEDDDPLVEIIATLFHELFVHAEPFAAMADLIITGGAGQLTRPNSSTVEEDYETVDRKTLFWYFMLDYIDPDDLDKGSLKRRLQYYNFKSKNSMDVNKHHLGLIEWYSRKTPLTIRSAQKLFNALDNFKNHPLYEKVKKALQKDAKEHLKRPIRSGIITFFNLCGITL